jgi:hypothetical protein
LSDLLFFGIFWGAILAWGVFRFFRPTPRQRMMLAMHDRVMREVEQAERGES